MAGRSLTVIDPYWARAWKSILRGQDPKPPRVAPAVRPAAAVPDGSAWGELGLAPGASLAELRRAFQRRSLETHPDQGGDAEAFHRVQLAYQKLLARVAQRAKRPQRKG